MRGLITWCFVISWTVICGTVLAQNEVDYESDKNEDESKELFELMREEEFLRTNLKKIENALSANAVEKKKCGESQTECPSDSTDCTEDAVPKEWYCKCKEGYQLPGGISDVGNKEPCHDIYKCDNDKKDCPNDNTKCVPKGGSFECECNEGFEPVDKNKKGADVECQLQPHVCKAGDCTGENTKCVVNGNKYTCDCNDGFVPADPNNQGKKESSCVAICQPKTCPTDSSKCMVKGNTYYCDCLPNYKLKEGQDKETNQEGCLKKTKCDDPSVKCDTETTTGCVAKGDNDYYCKCKDDHKPNNEKKDTDNKAACIKKTKCDDGSFSCPETTKCQILTEDSFYCKCLPNYVLPDGVEEKTNKDACTSGCAAEPCKNGASCQPKGKNYECNCAPFYSGTTCETLGCEKNPCLNSGKCDTKKEENKIKSAFCKCVAPFDGTLCETNTWCGDNKCATTDEEKADCIYDQKIGAGYCKCKKAQLRFNYKTQKCEAKPACLTKKCGENEVCENGECKCKTGYLRDQENNNCISKRCENACFDGSDCTEVGTDDIKCSCKSPTHYYISNQCIDASCLISSQRKNCKQNCPPSDMIRGEDGICRQKGDDDKIKTCSKSCGNFGYCHVETVEEKSVEKCVCIDEAVLNGDKCELQPSVCPSGVTLTADKQKCDCKGKFKYAPNQITCERKSCQDSGVQEECKKQNAICVNDWKNGNSYECKCKDGFTKDPKSQICMYQTNFLKVKAECSKNNKVAFVDETGRVACMCPPGIKSTGNNEPCSGKYSDKTTYLIQNLQVSKSKYTHNSVVDVFSLTKDVISAMMQTYQKLEFARLYKYSFKDDVIDCTVWLQFSEASEFDYKRIPFAAFDDGFLLPGLQLKKEKFKEVKGDALQYCSGQEGDPFCGATKCVKDECSCLTGYKVVDASIKQYDTLTLFTCEDKNECTDGSHSCPQDTTVCVNTEGSFYCTCRPKYKLPKEKEELKNQGACIDACKDPNPCNSGQCSFLENNQLDCSCDLGHSGSYCQKQDVALAGATKKTVVVGAVLGTILGVVILAVVVYVIKQRKNSYSEDFSPPPRGMDNAEMTERRPMRGVTNRAYQ